jgi:hypothetical protein
MNLKDLEIGRHYWVLRYGIIGIVKVTGQPGNEKFLLFDGELRKLDFFDSIDPNPIKMPSYTYAKGKYTWHDREE